MEKNYNTKKLFYVLKKWYVVVITTLIVTVATLLVNVYCINPVHVASTEIFIGVQSQSSDAKDAPQYDVNLYQNLMGTYEQLYKSYAVSYAAIVNSHLPESAMGVNNNLTVSFTKGTQLLHVSLKGYDSEQEVAILQALNQAFLSQAKNVLPGVTISITEGPSVANIVTNLDKRLNVFIGFIVGLSIGIGLAFLFEYFNNTFRDSEEVENELKVPVIGTIMKDNE